MARFEFAAASSTTPAPAKPSRPSYAASAGAATSSTASASATTASAATTTTAAAAAAATASTAATPTPDELLQAQAQQSAQQRADALRSSPFARLDAALTRLVMEALGFEDLARIKMVCRYFARVLKQVMCVARCSAVLHFGFIRCCVVVVVVVSAESDHQPPSIGVFPLESRV
jgi:hypothetical protein